MYAAAAAKSLQSCLTLCDPIDGSQPGSARHPWVLQARTPEWVAISFSNAWKWKVKVKLLSRVRLFAIPWTAAYQAPPSMGFSRQEYWSGVPLPSLILGLTSSKSVAPQIGHTLESPGCYCHPNPIFQRFWFNSFEAWPGHGGLGKPPGESTGQPGFWSIR